MELFVKYNVNLRSHLQYVFSEKLSDDTSVYNFQAKIGEVQTEGKVRLITQDPVVHEDSEMSYYTITFDGWVDPINIGDPQICPPGAYD
jgi:hypothetical protein